MSPTIDTHSVVANPFSNRIWIICCIFQLISFSGLSQLDSHDEQIILGLKANLRNTGYQLSGIEESHPKFVYYAKEILSMTSLDCYRLDNEDRKISFHADIDCTLVLKSKRWMNESNGRDIVCATLHREYPLEIISINNEGWEVRIDKLSMMKQ
jgi:hypothetical protein